MVSAITHLQFELSTGNMYTDQPAIEHIEAGQAPRNLIQLHAMGRLLLEAADHEPESELAPGTQSEPDVVPLRALLLGQHTLNDSVKQTGYEQVAVTEWNRADYIGYGQWLDSMTREPNRPRTRLSQQALRRARRLGIGPSDAQITRDHGFVTLGSYYRACKVLPNHERNAFADWSDQQLADYAEGVFVELQEQSGAQRGYSLKLNEELNRRAALGEGPSAQIYRRDDGWPMKYMAMNGYADTRSMEPEDYVTWGVRFMRVNDGKVPNPEAIDLLAQTRRAPISRTFMLRFRWGDYVDRVKSAYAQQQQDTIKQRLPAILQEIDAGVLPRDIFQGTTAEGFIGVRAKWLLVDGLLPKLARSHKRVIAQQVPVDKLKDVLRYTGPVEDDDIENAAAKMGVKEDLWPTVKEPYLRVPDELLI